jgi:hypothetical protein
MDKNIYYNFLFLNYFCSFHFQEINIDGMKKYFNEISIFYFKIIYIPNIIKFDKLFN